MIRVIRVMHYLLTPNRRAIAGGAVLLLLWLPASELLPPTRWNLHVWGRLRQAARQTPDTYWDRHYREPAPYIPATGTVGLLYTGSGDSAHALNFLQYSLAPRQIVQSVDHEFVIECGSTPADSVLVRNPNFTLVRAFGDDLRLFRRIAR